MQVLPGHDEALLQADAKFPIRGSFGGPGGNLEFEDLVFVLQNMVNKKMNKGKIASEGMFSTPMSMVLKENKLPTQ